MGRNIFLFAVRTLFGLIVIVAMLLILPGMFRANTAKVELEQIMVIAEGRGLEVVCGQGDDGHSIANTTPWYDWFATGEYTDQLTVDLTEWLLDNDWSITQSDNSANGTIIEAKKEGSEFLLRESSQDQTCSWDALADDNYPSKEGYSFKLANR